MPLEKIYATVLQSVDYKDNDKVLTLLSPTQGLVVATARGCKRPKSPLLQVSEPFATGEFMLYATQGRYTVQSALIDHSYFDLRLNFEKLACGSYMLQLCQAVAQENDENHHLFKCLFQSLQQLLNCQTTQSIAVLNYFLFQFCTVEGFKPRVVHCTHCANKIGKDNHSILGFDYLEGGVVCDTCMNETIDIISSESYLQLYKLACFKPFEFLEPKKIHQQVFGVLSKYIELQIEKSIKAKKFIMAYFE